MATIKGRTLFFITSPRSPFKMITEIELLTKYFSDHKWNSSTQTDFIKLLISSDSFQSSVSSKDPALSARDRINRGPKALGFVDLAPVVKLTNAGSDFLDERLSSEALLRQLLKFQLPSPYHKAPKQTDELQTTSFFIKPFLEILRLISTLDKLTFDELKIFGLQLTNFNDFDLIVNKIKEFRKAKADSQISYKLFVKQYFDQELNYIYRSEIQSGQTKTRQSSNTSVEKFLSTKASNMRDYADSCFRYLRATGLVDISYRGHSLSIAADKRDEVDFILANISREPVFVDDESSFKLYLFDNTTPQLLTDDRTVLERKLLELEDRTSSELNISKLTTSDIKKALFDSIAKKQHVLISQQVKSLKDRLNTLEVIGLFEDIKNNALYDTPLMLEWNTWRALNILNGGSIKANLNFDDNGMPLSTATGNMPDILCDYDEFFVTVEVTMQSGHKQFESEGESVIRHLAKIKGEFNKPAYCLFITPKINESCVAYFYSLHKTNISYYHGKSVVIPLALEIFIKMVESAINYTSVPTPNKVKELCEFSLSYAQIAKDEVDWHEKVIAKALNWLK